MGVYWNINKTLSYNAFLNFIVGMRGVGKTYGAKNFCIKRFLKCREQFVYVRRFDKELKKIKTFFSDISDKFPEHDFRVEKGCFIIDDEIAGYYMPLSTAKVDKGAAFPDVTTIVYDEFILDAGVHHYLPDEVTAFLELVETIFRMRDNGRVIALSNAITITNPYFLEFELALPYGKNIIVKNDCLFEMVENPEYVDAKKATRFGRLISGTQYGNYAIENQFLRDNDTFIEKKSGNCSYLFTFIWQGEKLGVWCSYIEGKIWVSNDIDELRGNTFAFSTADHSPNTMLLSTAKSNKWFKFFAEQYALGNVYFESAKIKGIAQTVIKLSKAY